MSDSAASKFWRRHARKILGFALFAFAIHDIFGAHGFLAMQRTQRDMDRLRTDITRLNRENGELADHVKSLKTDPRAIERLAREMGWRGPAS